MRDSGEIDLICVRKYQPKYEELLDILQGIDGAMAQLSWIDRLQMKYTPKAWGSPMIVNRRANRTSAPPASTSSSIVHDTESQGEHPQEGDANVDLEAELGDLSTLPVLDLEDLDDLDIVTGQPTRDLKLDPVRQFKSLFSRK